MGQRKESLLYCKHTPHTKQDSGAQEAQPLRVYPAEQIRGSVLLHEPSTHCGRREHGKRANETKNQVCTT